MNFFGKSTIEDARTPPTWVERPDGARHFDRTYVRSVEAAHEQGHVVFEAAAGEGRHACQQTVAQTLESKAPSGLLASVTPSV